MIVRPADHSAKLARGELSDPARVEELEQRAGEDILRRRDFLGRTAALVKGSRQAASMVLGGSSVRRRARDLLVARLPDSVRLRQLDRVIRSD